MVRTVIVLARGAITVDHINEMSTMMCNHDAHYTLEALMNVPGPLISSSTGSTMRSRWHSWTKNAILSATDGAARMSYGAVVPYAPCIYSCVVDLF